MKKRFICISALVISLFSAFAISQNDGILQRLYRMPADPPHSAVISAPVLPAGLNNGPAAFVQQTPVTVKSAAIRKSPAAGTAKEVQLPEGASKSWWAEAQENIRKSEYNISLSKTSGLSGIDMAYQAPNRANNLRTYFTDEGIVVAPRTGDAKWTWGLRPRLSPPPSPPWQGGEKGEFRNDALYTSGVITNESRRPSVNGNRVEYSYGPVTAWYVNDERGIEQGFRIDEPVEALTKDGQLRLEMAITGGLRAGQAEKGKAIDFLTDSGKRAIRYDQLHVFDATGRELNAGMEMDEGRQLIALVVDAADARYPLLIDPLISGAYDAMLESDQSNAGFGISVAGAGDVNGDGYADVIVGASAFDKGETNEGAAFVYHGGPSGISSTPSVTLESNQDNAWFGWSVAGAGDVNGDGYSDVIVGTPYFDNGQPDEGAAFIYHGGPSGISSTPSVTLEADQADAGFGYSVAGVGDVNGDGYSDVIVGAFAYDNGQPDEGAAFIYHGGPSGISSTPSVTLEADQADAYFGYSVAGAGDVNGDGYSDVIVGAPYYDNGQTDEGAAFVYHGGPSGISSTPSVILEADQDLAYFGYSAAGAGDVNGDGYSDVIVGAHGFINGQTYEGAAFVYHGGPSGISSTPSVTLVSNQGNAWFGLRVAGAGDVNGDGYSDIIVAAPNYDNGETNEGAAFVYHGGPSGISSTPSVILESNQDVAQLGRSIAGAGDVNGDGYADVIVGATNFDNGETDEGAAFIYHGGPSGISSIPSVILESNQVDAVFGWSVAGAGDVNGDGYADVIVGATNFDNGETDEGTAFVYHGGASGISSTPSVTLEPNQDLANFGGSVAGAGDVNGDGYADVIVGATNYDNGQTDEGAAFVYHGNSGTGRPVLSRQLRHVSLDYVQPWGESYSSDSFVVRMTATSPYGRCRIKLEAEACPGGAPFGDASCINTVAPFWTDVTAASSGVIRSLTVTGLAPDTLYRWRARVLYAPYSVTQSGITAPAAPAHGPWRRLLAQAFEADIRTAPVYTVTVNSFGAGWGEVSSNIGGIDYIYQNSNTRISGQINFGVQVVLMASADAGSEASWIGCDSTAGTTSVAICTIDSISSNRMVSAVFTHTSEANFSGTPRTGTAPFQVSFSSSSTNNPTSWAWDFGDGETGLEQNPAHSYRAAGTYAVSLTATGSGSATVTKSAYITVTSCGTQPVRISGPAYYSSVQTAYVDASDSDTIEMQAVDFGGGLTMNDPANKTVTLKGGYDCSYLAARIPYTAIIGTVTISRGSAIVDQIAIR